MGNTIKSCHWPKSHKDEKETKHPKKHGKKTTKKTVTNYKWAPNSTQQPTVLPAPNGTDINAFYVVGQELGRGEFGITYLCIEKLTSKKYACKSISKKKLRTQVDIEDVKREVVIMERLPSHTNIVKLVATYEDDDAVHIVMELCEGGELFDRIVARGHYTERDAAVVTKTIVEVVQVDFYFP